MRKSLSTLNALLFTLCLAVGFTGCTDDESATSDAGGGSNTNDAGGGGAAGDSPNLGEKTSATISAADGGSVELKNAGVKLDIPAGALGEDTKISAEVVSLKALPGRDDLAGNAIEFLPKGLTFEKPVALSIDLAGAKVPEGAVAALSWLDETTNEWVDLEGAKVEGGAVTAETTHFTIFVIRFIVDDNGNVVQDMGMCSGGFKPCGGDIEGTWNITSGCADVPASIGQQVTAQCAGATFTFGLDITGDITFAAGKITGTLETSSETVQVMPKTCGGEMCDASDPDAGLTVTDTGDACEEKKTKMETSEIDSTYVLDAATKSLTITDNDALSDGGVKAPKMSEYCVTGDTLVVRTLEDNMVHVQWTATRK